MDSKQPPVEDYNHPVAYDAEGRPLYAHPPIVQEQAETKQSQIVHVARPVNPQKQVVDDATLIKHEQSKKVFPNLNLSEYEYVISAVKRHPIGMVPVLLLGLMLIVFSFIILFNYSVVADTLGINYNGMAAKMIVVPLSLFILFDLLMMYVYYYIYSNNNFYLTNESVIQEIQTSLFAKREQTVSLSNIEDVSYSQGTIFHRLFDFGSIRLSTQGDETTYRFSYVAGPKKHTAVLNNAVEAFKNGRPVEADD